MDDVARAVRRKLSILCIKDEMMKMSAHNFCCLILGLWSGIAGIVTLTSNDKSQCAESYQTLMVLGIGLTVFSLFFAAGKFRVAGV